MVRLWLFENDEGVGLIGMLGIAALIAGVVVAVLLYPVGPSQRTTGTITYLGLRGGKSDPYRTATVALGDGRQVVVKPLHGTGCVVGGLIRLREQRRLWGVSVVQEWPPCL